MRTGVALSDPGRVLATPLEVVPTADLTEYLGLLFEREDVREVVVGMPKTLAGEIGPQARRVLDTLDALRREFPDVRFVEWDERLTTRVAAAGGRSKKKGKRVRVDQLAAAGMLQEYLARRGGL